MKYNLVYSILSEVKKSTYSGVKVSKLTYNIQNFLNIKTFSTKLSILKILYVEGYINGFKLVYSYKKNNTLKAYDLTNFFLSKSNIIKLFYKNFSKSKLLYLKRQLFTKVEKIEKKLYHSKKYFLYKKYNYQNITNNKKYIYILNSKNEFNLLPINNVKININIYYKYTNRLQIITQFLQISKPSRRVFISVKEFDQFLFFYTKKIILKKKKSLGILLLSTNKGILSNNLAKKKNIGGELLSIIL